MFEKVEASIRRERQTQLWCRPASPKFSTRPTMCWSRSGRKILSRGSSATSGVDFDKWEMPIVDKTTFQSTHPKVFFGGDAAFGPENVITAVAHGHQAAISIDLLCNGEDLLTKRLDPMVNLVSQKMGIHEWAYDSEIDDTTALRRAAGAENNDARSIASRRSSLASTRSPVTRKPSAALTAMCRRSSTTPKCIECDACVDICPTSCITFTAERRRTRAARHD